VSHPSTRPVSALVAVVAWSLVTGVLVGLGTTSAEAAVPRAAFRYTAAIEPLAGYVGQSVCSPTAKPGTTAFANLLLRTYPTSRSLGISRSCSVGGRSEHKEGRAFDWGVSVYDAKQRASVDALMTWLLKSDRYGNRHAMARRLGIQYMIWNRRIWGAYAAGSGWRRYTGSNPHTDHVHFSLSWAGARKKTSFWSPRRFPNSSGSAPSQPTRPSPDRPSTDGPSRPSDRHDWPEPKPDSRSKEPRALPEPRPPRTLLRAAPVAVEQLRVPARRRAGVLTRRALVAGRRYLIEVSGTYRYGARAGAIADGECSTRPGASWWQRERSLRSEQWYADHLDLYVDGNDLYAHADDGRSCDVKGNTYRWVYEPRRTGRVPFAVWDPSRYTDNRGRLNVRILDLGTLRDSMAWRVPARRNTGATSPGLLRGGGEYLVTVSGTWRSGKGLVADAECLRGPDGSWRRDGDSYAMVTGDWAHGGLAPRMREVSSEPVDGAADCDPENGYTFVFRPERTTPLNIRVSDPGGHADNTGALKVRVTPYRSSTPTPGPTPGPTPSPSPSPGTPLPDLGLKTEKIPVDARSMQPVRTAQEYPVGTSLRVTAAGMYFMRQARDWIVADAECTVTYRDSSWRTARFQGTFGGITSPLGDLVVNGGLVTWNPSGGRDGCDSREHVYTYDLTTTEQGPVWFVIADDHYGDNRGSLDVTVEVE
jgi:hypothetical protein